MHINLLTDAPRHNHALMKISTYHKAKGDIVCLNFPAMLADYTYVSLLYSSSLPKYKGMGDVCGGPAYVGSSDGGLLDPAIEACKPDYSLYGLDYSLGYTYRPCSRKCKFCKVGTMLHPDTRHHSIWEFHDDRFKKICLLNNNTFQDPDWRQTFEEIRDADLVVMDENGYDLRLLDVEKATALAKTKFGSYLHFAWDRIQDEAAVIRGLTLLKNFKLQGHIYVLIGYDTTEEQDIYRCQKIVDLGYGSTAPYIMPYTGSKKERRFKRFIDTFMWRKYDTIAEAWKDYKGKEAT